MCVRVCPASYRIKAFQIWRESKWQSSKLETLKNSILLLLPIQQIIANHLLDNFLFCIMQSFSKPEATSHTILEHWLVYSTLRLWLDIWDKIFHVSYIMWCTQILHIVQCNYENLAIEIEKKICYTIDYVLNCSSKSSILLRMSLKQVRHTRCGLDVA